MGRSVDGAEVLVEPVENSPDHVASRERVCSLQDHVPLIRLRCSEEIKQRFLGRLDWEDVIVPAVDHQDGEGDPGDVVYRVDFGQERSVREASAQENSHFEPRFEGKER